MTMEEKVKSTDEISEKDLQERVEDKVGGKLEEWRKRYAPKQLTIIEVEDKVLVLRPITPDVMAKYSMMMATDGMDVATRYALNELALGGDSCVIDEDDYFMSAMMQFATVIELKKAVVSKL